LRDYFFGPTKPWWFPGWPSFRDFAGACIIGFTGLALWGALSTGTDDGLRHAAQIAGILGTASGAVLGFWYGERGARQAEDRAQQANRVEGRGRNASGGARGGWRPN
jgi:hypothetical protein